MTDLVAVWDVALSDGVHKIEFEHGTTSGKRVVYVDGKEEIRREWMFKLVGKETFFVGAAKTKATINIDAISGFAYEYTLEIDGKSLKKYMENRSKTTNTWVLHLDGEELRVVLEKDTMDVWCNGQRMETATIKRPRLANWIRKQESSFLLPPRNIPYYHLRQRYGKRFPEQMELRNTEILLESAIGTLWTLTLDYVSTTEKNFL